ncbi:MAG: type I DNA topoisomerase, partial [Planctomycetes bacterium]|nr:type I DNA topoisomerase [Planctomycetota bacterium]
FKVSEVQTKRTQSRPSAPFITSALQQQGVNRLGFSTKRTMRIAQQLYEGMEVSGQGSVGLITYMRTDSTHLAKEAVDSAREFIVQEYGQEYLSEKVNIYAKKNSQAQEAHEAIRPTDVRLRPEDVAGDLDKDQMKLYEMIWKRFVSCQMSPTQWDVTSISITAPADGGDAVFKASGRKLVFDGFMKVSGLTISNGEQLLPELNEGQEVNPFHVDRSQHFTAPPARYTEASLVKSLESEGIGRPSTYATIISTIQDRGYVEQIDKKFHATDLGMVVTEKLDEFFPQVMDVAFTRHVEEQLDAISEKQLDWVKVLEEFYGPFKKNLDRAHEEMVHAKAETQPSEYSCPKCKEPVVYRFGKNGRFLSCSAYPECKYSSPCDREGKIQEVEVSEHKCPVCSKPMLFRQSRFGKFLGCSGYPECKTTQKIDKEGNVLPPTPPPIKSGIRCYKCKGELVIRASKRGPFLGCGSFPKCRTIVSIKQLDHLKELQEKGQWPPATREEVDIILGRKKAATTKIKPKAKAKPKPRAKAKAKPREKAAVAKKV